MQSIPRGRLLGVLEQVDDEPLRCGRLREGHPSQKELTVAEAEATRALGVVDERHGKHGGRPEPEGVPRKALSSAASVGGTAPKRLRLGAANSPCASCTSCPSRTSRCASRGGFALH